MSEIQKVDARGLSCPQPVLLTQNVIKKLEKGIVEVLVDSNTARDNVKRTATNAGWQVNIQELEDGVTRLTLTK